jgi:hypothetical protein
MKIGFIFSTLILSYNLYSQDTIRIELICNYKRNNIYFYHYRNNSTLFDQGLIDAKKQFNVDAIDAKLIKKEGKYHEGDMIEFWIARRFFLSPFKRWQLISINYEKKAFLIIRQNYKYKRKYHLVPHWSDNLPKFI